MARRHEVFVDASFSPADDSSRLLQLHLPQFYSLSMHTDLSTKVVKPALVNVQEFVQVQDRATQIDPGSVRRLLW
jgi:hypothetical protein